MFAFLLDWTQIILEVIILFGIALLLSQKPQVLNYLNLFKFQSIFFKLSSNWDILEWNILDEQGKHFQTMNNIRKEWTLQIFSIYTFFVLLLNNKFRE